MLGGSLGREFDSAGAQVYRKSFPVSTLGSGNVDFNRATGSQASAVVFVDQTLQVNRSRG